MPPISNLHFAYTKPSDKGARFGTFSSNGKDVKVLPDIFLEGLESSLILTDKEFEIADAFDLKLCRVKRDVKEPFWKMTEVELIALINVIHLEYSVWYHH